MGRAYVKTMKNVLKNVTKTKTRKQRFYIYGEGT